MTPKTNKTLDLPNIRTSNQSQGNFTNLNSRNSDIGPYPPSLQNGKTFNSKNNMIGNLDVIIES